MGRRKKPGTPGRTTIPLQIVSAVTDRLGAEFSARKYHLDHHLFVVPQQDYLYVEVRRKEFGSPEPRPAVDRGSTTHLPLGRLKFMGTADEWQYQPYRYSDECWDDRGMETGSPESLLLSMVVDRL